MSEPFVGEIKMFAGNFAPRGWAFCDGQLLAVSQNDALFSLFGTIYGGDGRITFGLPDLRGRLPMHAGQGSGLSNRRLGTKFGSENVTLMRGQIPTHSHSFHASNAEATSPSPQSRLLGKQMFNVFNTSATNTNMGPSSIGMTGGTGSHTNLMPALCINFIVALVGIYPSRQ
ncbi:Phage Tail Collar Domain protein [Pseudovibrio sp. Ad13]|uniref:phage tail protein n=1 Tax=Pseudovibrio sp. Ad13 TaxID=989396 RepID=UPI0007AE5451|nr:tail fiber protein [Pseudovibrio sp. Ad13]KZK84504.1 Phage Tail Collar Domain protein [Pseudovibrio sp. Ad13]